MPAQELTRKISTIDLLPLLYVCVLLQPYQSVHPYICFSTPTVCQCVHVPIKRACVHTCVPALDTHVHTSVRGVFPQTAG